MSKILLLSLTALLVPAIAQAQTIVPDATLPENSVVETTENVHNISGGTTAGNHLFHSFSEFGVNTGDTAVFDNDAGIENIFSRVTGSNVSNIDGLIEANDANIFLLNPNGIVFGENAAIDIGGEFSAIAGESIQFEDGEYSAVNPTNSTLSINLPLGVQLGQAEIAITGSGSGLFFNEFDEPDLSERVGGLSNSQINLLAGNIRFDGGNVTAPEGILNLIATSGSVEFTSEGIAADEATGEIDLINSSSISSSSAEGSGAIAIQTGNLNLADGSAVVANNDGTAAAGSIKIDASGDINVIGESAEFPSFIGADNGFFATQAGGEIEINADKLNVDAGGVVSASSYGEADGGRIDIDAKEVVVNSGGAFASSLAIESLGGANGGTLDLNAEKLAVTSGGSITATATTNSTGGTIDLDVTELTLSEPDLVDGEIFNPTIVADSFDEATAGSIKIEADSMTVANSGQVTTSTNGTGAGGAIEIEAKQLNVTNDNLDENYVTGIFSASGIEPTEAELGTGGSIVIDSQGVVIDNQALISTRTLSGGDAGNITLKSDSLNVNEQGSLNSAARGGGIGGNLSVDVSELKVTSGGQINASTDNAGDGGNITIDAQQVEVTGTGPLGNSGIFAVGVEGSGNAGNITLDTDGLAIEDGGVVTVSNFSSTNANLTPGTGAPGKIDLDANTIEITNSTGIETGILSKVNQTAGGNIEIDSNNLSMSGAETTISSASLGEGEGGSVAIDAEQTSIDDNAAISVSASSTGNAGNISLKSDRLTANAGKILAESVESGGGDIRLSTQEIDLENDSLVSTSVAESEGGGGNLTIDNQETILLRNSDLRANAFAGPGGNINITTNVLFRDLTSDIDASSEFGIDGTVEVTEIENDKNLTTVILPEEIVDPTAMIAGVCPVADENSFAYVGNGGIAETPAETAYFDSSWNDLRPLNATNQMNQPAQDQLKTSTPVYEADRLVADANGEVYLLAQERVKGDRWSRSDCQ